MLDMGLDARSDIWGGAFRLLCCDDSDGHDDSVMMTTMVMMSMVCPWW